MSLTRKILTNSVVLIIVIASINYINNSLVHNNNEWIGQTYYKELPVSEIKEKQLSRPKTREKHASFFERIDQELIANLSRPFSLKLSTVWCIPQNDLDVDSPSGILYTKVPKTGSTVISSVLERISRNNAFNTTCALMYRHHDRFLFLERIKEKSIMIGSLRDPVKRGISRAFFKSKNDYKPTDEQILRSLHSTGKQRGVLTKGKGGFQLDYMNLDQIEEESAWKSKRHKITLNHNVIDHYVREMMNDYHFIFLNERLTEGLVALKFLLNLRTSDLLYFSSKISGGYYSWPGRKKCIKLAKGYITPTVSEYVSSEEWFLKNYGDYLAYAVANRSLDLTREAIGKEKFNETLYNFITLSSLVESKCAPRTRFPCSADGEYHDDSDRHCYWNDVGCGWACFDQFTNHTLAK